jgi:Amt family ammonium transporter
MMAWMLFDAVKGARPTAMGACIGAVVGLVAITPAAGFVSVGASIFIGVSASIISNLAVHWRSRTELDDTLDVFPCHGLGGIVGMVLTAVFATDGGLVPTGEVSLVVNHLIALVGVSVFALGGSVLLFWLVGRIMPLRVSESDEAAGLDQSMHGEKYPHIEGLAA